MPRPRSWPWRRFAWVLALVLLDQLTKSIVFDYLNAAEGLAVDRHGHPRLVLGVNWLAFMESYNKGAAFGGFGDYPHALVVGRILAVGVLGWLLWNQDRREGAVVAAMVLVLSGAIGNLVDNLATGRWEVGHPFGMVRDFIDVWFLHWDWHFPTFNVADSCITVGAVIWIGSGLFHRRQPEEDPDEIPSVLRPHDDPPPPPPRALPGSSSRGSKVSR